MQPQEETMTAQEARTEFSRVGLSESTLRRWAREGRITRIKSGVYSRYDVLEATKKLKKKQTGKESLLEKEHYLPSHVRIATAQDTPGIATLSANIFGGVPNPDRWLSWMRKNPDIAYVGIANETIISCGFILPFHEKKILTILAQEITPPTHPDEILEYTPDTPVCLYARTICVSEKDADGKNYSHAQRRIWAGALLLGITRGIIHLGARGIVLDKIYGRSDTPDGERALRSLGCTEIKTTTTHHNFVIDVPTSGLNMIRRYEQRYLEWQRSQYGSE